MTSALIIGETNYSQNCCRKHSEECKLLSFDLTDNIEVASSGNCEVLGTLINIFKSSTQTTLSSESSNYNIATNEPLGSNLVNNSVTSEKCRSHAIAETTKPTIQDFSKVGCDNVESSESINGSVSTISNDSILHSGPIDQKRNTLTVVDAINSTEVVFKEIRGNESDIKKLSGTQAVGEGSVPSAVDERSKNSAVDERSKNPAVDERSKNPAVDESSDPSTVAERKGPLAVYERCRLLAVDGRSGLSVVSERCEYSAIAERSRPSAVDEKSGPSAIDERPRTPAILDGKSKIVDEISGTHEVVKRRATSDVDKRSESSAVYERPRTPVAVDGRSKTNVDEIRVTCEIRTIVKRCDSQAVDEKSGIAAVVDRPCTPYFSRGKTDLYKSPIKMHEYANKQTTSPNKSVYEHCPDNKNKQSTKLMLDCNHDNKINSRDCKRFIETIHSVNSDMVKKSRKLLRKQTFVKEIVSYIQASQSVCRLLLPRNIFVDDMLSFDFSSKESFYSAGEYILEELQLYLSNLKADFKVWEARRNTILRVSANIPKQLEQCYSEYSARVLMHEISTGISSILQEMNDITTNREESDIELLQIWEGTDKYIIFSSSYIIDKPITSGSL